MKKILLSFATICISVFMFILPKSLMAININEDIARQYSVYYLSVMSGKNEVKSSDAILAYTFQNEVLNIPAAYVFNVAEQGFVIISGSDLWYPILGYSTEDTFDAIQMPPALKWYIEELCQYIVYSQNTGHRLINNIEQEWNDLKNRTLPRMHKPKAAEWLLDSEWGQGNSYTPTYNKYCPSRDIDNVHRTAITGCVATAMSQIMYYWKYPKEPINDTIGYECWIDDTVFFSNLSIDLSDVVYDFDTMPNKLTSTSTTAEIDATALLCYHAGVSVEMGYGINGSGAFSNLVPDALRDVFLYDTAIAYDTRKIYYLDGTIEVNYTNDEWITMLTNEIAAHRPVYYSGCGVDTNGDYVGGHAFVCDGHHATDSNKFHFNWGWNGYLNMWCDVRNNEIGVVTDGDSLNFNEFQSIIRFIQPRICRNPQIESITTTHESATMNWLASADNYQILYKEVSATDWCDTINTAENSYTFTNLLPETNYIVQLRALCGADNGNTSTWSDTTFTTGAFICCSPTNLSITDIHYESARLSWNSEGVASRWVVNVFNDSYSFTDTVDMTSFVITNLSAGNDYNVAINSICSSTVMSGWSDTISFTTLTCHAVSNLTVNTTYNSAHLSWNGSAANYQLIYKEMSATEWSDTLNTDANDYTLTGLLSETSYMAKIRARCASESGAQSIWSELSFTTDEFICPIPTDLSIIELSYESATIGWNSESTHWIIHLFNDSYNLMDTLSVNSFTINNLSAGNEYHFVVKSMCSEDDTSEWSDTLTFVTTSCQTVTNLVADYITTYSTVISWDSPDALNWEICYGIGTTQGEGEIRESTDKYYAITGLEANTTYNVYIRTHCTDNIYGEWSDKLTFTTEKESQGIQGAVNDIQFEIYPNPTSGATTISLKGVDGRVSISIIDLNGCIITSEVLECGFHCEKTVDVVGLSHGTYFIKVLGDTINSVRKLIVK